MVRLSQDKVALLSGSMVGYSKSPADQPSSGTGTPVSISCDN